MNNEPEMSSCNLALVLVQALGNVTYTKNLQAYWETEPYIKSHWIEVHHDPQPPKFNLPLLNNWSLRGSWQARRKLNALKARPLDALFFHTEVISLLSIDVMRRVPTIISLDATPMNNDTMGSYYYHQPSTGSVIDRLKFQWTRLALHSAAAIVPWSDWARRSLIDDYGVAAERIHIIPPGVQIDRWAVPPREVHSDPVRILFVGGDFDRKGGSLLLEAWRQHLRDRAELHLVTYSEISPEPGVYVYQGLQPNSPELHRLYAKADIFALPTLGDSLGIVLAEAGASGLPVVSTNMTGIPEVVWHGESGLLCPVGDVHALAAALSQLIDNPELRRSMGMRAREIITKNFDGRKNTQRLTQLLSHYAVQKKRKS